MIDGEEKPHSAASDLHTHMRRHIHGYYTDLSADLWECSQGFPLVFNPPRSQAARLITSSVGFSVGF